MLVRDQVDEHRSGDALREAVQRRLERRRLLRPLGEDVGQSKQVLIKVRELALRPLLAPPMLGPIHARGDELNGGGVHDVDGALEPMHESFAGLAAGKARVQRLEMIEHRPEELLGHAGIALLVGVRKIIAAGRSGATDCRKITTG